MNRKIFFLTFRRNKNLSLNSIVQQHFDENNFFQPSWKISEMPLGGGDFNDKLALHWKFPGSGCSKAKVSSAWPSDPDAKC